MRADKIIGSSLEAEVALTSTSDTESNLKAVYDLLPTVFIVSEVTLNDGAAPEFTGEATGVGISVKHAEGEKCERCWTYSKSVGECAEHPTLCARCANTLSKINK